MITAVLVIIANYTVLPIFNLHVKYTLTARKKTTGDKDIKTVESHTPPPSDFTLIAEENLFHPDRKIPAEKKEEQPLPKPDFVLYAKPAY